MIDFILELFALIDQPLEISHRINYVQTIIFQQSGWIKLVGIAEAK